MSYNLEDSEELAASSTLEMDVRGSSETSENTYLNKECDKKVVIPTFISVFISVGHWIQFRAR